MSVYVTGDKHGHLGMPVLVKRRRRKSLGEGDKLIIAGDFGLVWRRPPGVQEQHWLRWLDEQKWETLFVDGNHENFELLNRMPEEQRYGGLVGRVGEKIFHLKRGTIYEIEEKSILTMGGALSVDKNSRTPYVAWWPEEIPSYADLSNCLDSIHKWGGEVDYVITHTCPREVALHLEGVYGFGKLDDPTGKILSHIASAVKFKRWFFGHWHIEKTYGKFQCIYDDIVMLGQESLPDI